MSERAYARAWQIPAERVSARSWGLLPRGFGTQGSARVQPKLAVGRIDDPLEREADLAAEAAVRAPGSRLQPQAEEEGRLPRAPSMGGARSATGGRLEAVPPIVGEVLGSPGRPLDPATRATMESRFGQDFGRVRIHADSRAGESARAVRAQAFTVGEDVVFAAGRYRPGSNAGRRLLAHELAHVVQQRRTAPTLRRQEEEGEAPDELRLRWPGPRPGAESLFGLRLRLGEDLEPPAAASSFVAQLLEADRIRRSLLQLDYTTFLASTPPPWLTPVPAIEERPLVPRGAGPETPRAAEAGDAVRAVLAIPAVDAALTRLRDQAAREAERSWSELSTGERVLVITQGALITGTALSAALANDETRLELLNLVQDRSLPVPGVPGLSFQFNATGPDRRVVFGLNVGALLPPSLGFGQ